MTVYFNLDNPDDVNVNMCYVNSFLNVVSLVLFLYW